MFGENYITYEEFKKFLKDSEVLVPLIQTGILPSNGVTLLDIFNLTFL